MKETTKMKTKNVGMIGLLVAALGLGCGNVEPKEAEHAGSTLATTNSGRDKPRGGHEGKPSAPVEIDGKVGVTEATLAVEVVASATNVTIDVWGVDGLTVTNSRIMQVGQVVTSTRFAKGDRVDVNVTFTAPPTVRTNLAVRVRGTFGGTVRERVQSFTVNGDMPAATKAPGEVKLGPDGTPVRVMKVE